MTAPLTEVGFSELYATNMAEALGVKNLRDLCSLSGGEINRAFTPNYLNFTCRILSNYGLKLTPWKVRKHALAQPQTPNGEDSLGDE